MISINEAKRLIKRALLANLTTKKQDLAITPLVSGKHGIGKSQMVKSIARDLGGVCITIEGGTLKEGEITGTAVSIQGRKRSNSFPLSALLRRGAYTGGRKAAVRAVWQSRCRRDAERR